MRKPGQRAPWGNPPLLRLLPHLSPEANPLQAGRTRLQRVLVSSTKEELLRSFQSPAAMRSPALGLASADPFQGARGFGARVLRGQSEGARPDLRAGDPQGDQPEQTGSGGRTSFQALGGIPALRPFVRPPAGPMLSTGAGQYSLKRGKSRA